MSDSLNHSLNQFVKTTDSFRNKAGDCLYETVIESFTHLIYSNGWFIYKWSKRISLWMSYWTIDSLDSFKRWFIRKWSKWLLLWMNHWIIDSLDSFKRLIHSEMKQVTVFMNESLNHWLTRFVQTADSFRNEASDCLYEWVTESLTHSIRSNCWLSDWLYEWVIESLTHSIRSNGWFIPKWSKWLLLWMSHWIIDSLDSFKRLIKWLLLWMNHWIIDSLDSFKWLIHSETKQVTVFMNESLNHWLTRFVQMADSFRNESRNCLYDESLNHCLTWFVQSHGLIQ